MDQHKQRGEKGNKLLCNTIFLFFVPTGQQLTHFQQQRDGSQLIFLSLGLCLCPCMLDFEFNSMLNVLFFATLRKCIRPDVSLQVSIILLHSVHECIQFAHSFLKTKNKIYNSPSQKKRIGKTYGNQFLSFINFH